jgi:deoxyadenosine/deoxycytidine kinase
MNTVVAGNIGSGKSTLTKLLSEHYGWKPDYESIEDNPYLDDFYNKMDRWSFNLQIYFLEKRYRKILELNDSGVDTIQDRSIYEDAYIFAPSLHAMGLMSNRDYECYKSIFELMEKLITPPKLMIYIRSSIPTLVAQIQKRGRSYEQKINVDYLSRLNERYEAWIATYNKSKLVILEVDQLNFEEKNSDFLKVIKAIDNQSKVV